MPIIIAEVKTQSPFGFRSQQSWDELFEIANQFGDWISIHTDPRWGGSFELLARARQQTKKPILAKGIHADDRDIELALERGADYVLVVGRIPRDYRDSCLIEPHTLDELAVIPRDLKAVWNARDLSDGSVKPDTYSQARKQFSGWLCQASMVKHSHDVHADADAVLVGENLREFTRSIK